MMHQQEYYVGGVDRIARHEVSQYFIRLGFVIAIIGQFLITNVLLCPGIIIPVIVRVRGIVSVHPGTPQLRDRGKLIEKARSDCLALVFQSILRHAILP